MKTIKKLDAVQGTQYTKKVGKLDSSEEVKVLTYDDINFIVKGLKEYNQRNANFFKSRKIFDKYAQGFNEGYDLALEDLASNIINNDKENAITEKGNKTLSEYLDSMMEDAKITTAFWDKIYLELVPYLTDIIKIKIAYFLTHRQDTKMQFGELSESQQNECIELLLYDYILDEIGNQ